MTETWDPTIYHEKYLKGFNESDLLAVDRIVDYLVTKPPVSGFAIELREATAVVYTLKNGENNRPLLTEINWADPEVAPTDYLESSTSFISLEGPKEQQERRAFLLSKQFGATLMLYNRLEGSLSPHLEPKEPQVIPLQSIKRR